MSGRAFGVFLLLVFLPSGGARGFDRLPSRAAPLAYYDVRTNLPPATGLSSRIEVSSALEALQKGLPAAIYFRLDPQTGRPRHIFSLDGRLTGPSAESPVKIAKDFLLAHSAVFGLSPQQIDQAALADLYRHPDGGSVHLVLQQRCGGLDVFDGRVQFAIDREGRLINVAGEYHPGLQSAGKVELTPLQALQWAAAHCDRTIPRGQSILPKDALTLAVLSPERGTERRVVFAPGPLRDPVCARLVIMPIGGGKGIAAWEMTLHLNDIECYHVLVDAADGSLLYRSNLYKFAQPAGAVFIEHPDAGTQTTVSFAGDPLASPAGWCDATSATQGNNCVARDDGAADNEITLGFQPFRSDYQFLYSFANSWADAHTTASDAGAVVTNLFYHVNKCHDLFYRLGFDEVSGNFQLDNFGLGGAGNDRIHADAMDGAKFNNSNFLTLPDGDPPGPYGGHSRMQIYLYRPAPPEYLLYRDADLDGDTIVHEYAHGVTARMVGGPSNNLALEWPQALPVSEGWSDFFACAVFDDPVVGEYVTSNSTVGARHFAYNTHPWTFGDVGNTFEITSPTLPGGGPLATIGVPEEHSDGEIWAAALWALRTELADPALAQYLVVEALRYTPVQPNMLYARDAILLADALKFQGRHLAALWRAFARRGMGWSAQAEVGRKGMLMFEAFDWPPYLSGSFTTGTAIFSEDVEGDVSGWRVESNPAGAGVVFHTTSHRSAGGSRAWYFGREQFWDYDTGQREWSVLESPAIDLPSGAGCYLEFEHFRAAEDTVRWDFEPFYFDPGIIFVRVEATGLCRQVGFSFYNNGCWQTRRIDLSEFAGQRVRIGFYFDTWDGYNPPQAANEGWYIDNILVVPTQTINTPQTASRSSWPRY